MKGTNAEMFTGYRVPANARKAAFGPGHDRKLPFDFMAVRHPFAVVSHRPTILALLRLPPRPGKLSVAPLRFVQNSN